ncbi:hypothetical protein BJF79_47215 [Actinomadura sp. CNU-125]|uniref:acyltransferase domain-containing protein n=1 Tax=Actinomadura sp. CNU-125 TaxID=1904961 RepID=UPI0009687BB7|nr:acyltransferase domain-containing protein [Actinomadura sp. CNU-125]OLT18986.1 hypothetical protein BJF79_48010 [Actinomadura sp. CNU-125]OLT20685.1 hypothetical protein BJF79_47215 [Actinomadura sp. CNU-125]
MAHSLAVGRAAFRQRAAILADSRADLLSGLAALAADGPPRGPSRPGPTAFAFSGQGSQRPGMGRGLYEAFPVFAAAMDEIAEYFDMPVRDAMSDGAADLLADTSFTQPALFAFQIALFRLLESCGLRPDLLIGHSIGEVAAAHAAGVLSLPDAAALVSARGRLMQAARGDGAMFAVQAAEDEVRPLLTEGVDIAAVNAPSATVVSGTAAAAERIAARLAERGRRTRRLDVRRAFHSPHMDAVLDEFRAVAEGLSYAAPTIPIAAATRRSCATPLTGRGTSASPSGSWTASARSPTGASSGTWSWRPSRC